MFAKGTMNILLVLGFVLVASAFASEKTAFCEADLNECSPKLSSFKEHEKNTVVKDLQKYTSLLVDKSFHFLVMSSAFNQYKLDRPGFEKLYRKISDKAWEDAIELIKYQSRRGSFGKLVQPTEDGKYGKVLNVDELSSLKFALDYEKEMTKNAHNIHRSISHAVHNNGSKQERDVYNYDPDAAHYLDEHIIEYQSGVLRDLAGYIHILKGFKINDSDKSAVDLGTHLFDEYLEKIQ